MFKKIGQKGLQKITSLQAWSNLTEKYFGKKLRIEERKDRESIYTLLSELGLPTEKFFAFKSVDNLTQSKFLETVGQLGIPYWISVTPHVGATDLERLTKLGIESAKDGWEFIQSVPSPSRYKIIIMEYPYNIKYKGTAVVSQILNGFVDFVKGDKHYQLTSGLTLTDPMLFSSEKIVRYSAMIEKEDQDLIYSYVNDKPGHYEFQYGTNSRQITGLSFFDYDDRPAYENIDLLFQDLTAYFEKDIKTNGFEVKGLPTSLGKAKGKCRIIMGADENSFPSVKEGEILITDATNPNMTPIMKKVAAIVADLGGITSHASIVCRELGIPAIVGTKNGTQILKTGMEVEVDAFNGTVKIIKDIKGI